MIERWTSVGSILLLTGCVGQPPGPPVDSSTTSGSGDDRGTEPTLGTASVSDVGPADSSGSTSTGAPAESSSSSSTGPLSEDALLVFTERPQLDFGDVTIGAQGASSPTVTNVGAIDATGVVGVPLSQPFDYTGGAFPGAAGTCSDTLAAGDSCTLDVSFVPAEFGPYSGAIALQYDGAADAVLALGGRGVGQSDNLLVNPGGELAGQPPPGWVNESMGDWIADRCEVAAYEGGGCIYADAGPNFQAYRLTQSVDVSQWSTLIDLGELRASFASRARSLMSGNDEYRVRVHYRNAEGQSLQMYNSSWQSGAGWEPYSDMPILPVDTRTIEVELGCMKIQGTSCDVFFDALELRVEYP